MLRCSFQIMHAGFGEPILLGKIMRIGVPHRLLAIVTLPALRVEAFIP